MIIADKIPKRLRNGFSLEFLENAQHHTRKVDPQLSFSETITRYVEVMRKCDWAKKRSGAKFELAILWAILEDNRIDNEKISTHIHLYKEEKDAEVDFLIDGSPPLGLMAKTSTRERWAQWDRTALIRDRRLGTYFYNVKLYGIHHNEHFGSAKEPDWQPGLPNRVGEERNIRHVQNVLNKCVSLNGAYSVYDRRLDSLLDEFK